MLSDRVKRWVRGWDGRSFLFLLLSVIIVSAQLVVGIAFIPDRVLVNFDHYGRDSLLVLEAMGRYLGSNTFLALVAWLMPIVPAAYLPLRFTSLPLGIAAAAVSVVLVGSFLSPVECERFIHMLRTVPEMGYMWYETITISLVTFLVSPTSSLLLWAGPSACACLGPVETRRPSILFVAIAVTGMILVLPTVYIFVNTEGEFFLLGYRTDSLAGRLLSSGFILIWIRTYHLVCRDAYQTFLQSGETLKRVAAVVWAVFGTALVTVWVSSAYTLHFAYVSVLGLKLEGTFEEMARVWVRPLLKRVESWSSSSLERRGDGSPLRPPCC